MLIILNQLNLFFKNETKTATTELPVLKSHLAHNDESDRNTLTDELGMININCCCTWFILTSDTLKFNAVMW